MTTRWPEGERWARAMMANGGPPAQTFSILTTREIRLWHVKGRAVVRVIRREKAWDEAREAGHAAFGEGRLAAQARLLVKRLARMG